MPPRRKRLIPIGRGRRNRVDFRYITPPGDGDKFESSIKWASCETGIKSPFRRARNIPNFGAALTNADLGLIGIAGLALSAPLALAYIPTTFIVTSTSIIQAGGVSGGALSATIAGTSFGAIFQAIFKPRGARFADFSKPCSETRGAAF